LLDRLNQFVAVHWPAGEQMQDEQLRHAIQKRGIGSSLCHARLVPQTLRYLQADFGSTGCRALADRQQYFSGVVAGAPAHLGSGRCDGSICSALRPGAALLSCVSTRNQAANFRNLPIRGQTVNCYTDRSRAVSSIRLSEPERKELLDHY